MCSLDEVPFKIPLCFLENAQEEVALVEAPEVTLPDYLKILQETEYVFSLENWVLTGLQGGYSSISPRASCELKATCPPYWMMFSSPQESRLASRWSSDFWEPDPRPRSRSLNAAHYRSMSSRVKFTISDSEDDLAEEDGTEGGPKARRATPSKAEVHRSNFLHPPPSCGHASTPCGGKFRQSSGRRSASPRRCGLRRRSSSAAETTETTPVSKAQGSSPPPASAPSRPLRSHAAAPDSSVELLSALSPEERDLLSAVTERGYPLRTAIIALQKTGQQSPDQILSYLVACDHLCDLGYDEAQVEEALEMFQNCETKAEEFLHLLAQFNEMGFQPNAIKEVLLVHENHRERALEELMTRVA